MVLQATNNLDHDRECEKRWLYENDLSPSVSQSVVLKISKFVSMNVTSHDSRQTLAWHWLQVILMQRGLDLMFGMWRLELVTQCDRRRRDG